MSSSYGTKNYANLSEKYRKDIGKFNNKSHDKYTYHSSSQAHKQEVNSRIVNSNKTNERKNYLIVFLFLLVLCILGLIIGLIVSKSNDELII